MALGSVSIVSADQYGGGYTCSGGRCYQDPSYNANNTSYYQNRGGASDYQNQQPYSQNSQQTNRPYGNSQVNGNSNWNREGNQSYGGQQNDYNNYENQRSNPQAYSQQRGQPYENTQQGNNNSDDWNQKDNSPYSQRNGMNNQQNANRWYTSNTDNTNANNRNSYSESQLQNFEKKYPQDSATSQQDRQINAKIRDKLNGGWFSKGYDALIIKTANGVVIISGTVDKDDDISNIKDKLKDIEGIKSINAQLSAKNNNQ